MTPTWPCPACGRDLEPEGCACGERSAVLVLHRPWLGRWRRATWTVGPASGEARAEVVLAGKRLVSARGWAQVRRAMGPVPWPDGDGEVWLGSQELADRCLDSWWTSVHLRNNQVLGALTPSHARLGLGLAGRLLGARPALVSVWVQPWTRRGTARSTGDAWVYEVRIHQDDAERPVGDIARRTLAETTPDAWLADASRRASAAHTEALLAWIDERPVESAALVRDLLVGAGLLDQGSASSSPW